MENLNKIRINAIVTLLMERQPPRNLGTIKKIKEYAKNFVESHQHLFKGTESKPIDEVTVRLLDMSLRLCDIQINEKILDKIIDLVELIEDRGDKIDVEDICKLKEIWKNGKDKTN